MKVIKNAEGRITVAVRRFSELKTEELEAWRSWISSNVANQRAFLTPTFCGVVARVNAGVRVVLVYRDADLVAIFPLQPHNSWVGRFGVYEPVGGVMTDYFGVLSNVENVFSIEIILAKAGIGAVVFTHLDETQLALGLLGEAPRTGLRTVISGIGEQHWEQLRVKDKKLVSDTERRERKLVAEHGSIIFELKSATPDKDLGELIALKQAQYERTDKLVAPLFEPSNEDMLRALLHSQAQECAGVLSVMRVNGKLVAAHFGLRCLNVLHFWFPVYAVEFSAYSPGRILYKYVIREGSKEGIEVLDRGEGDTHAKRDFANEEHIFYSGIWWPRNVRGLLARLVLSVMWRIGNTQLVKKAA